MGQLSFLTLLIFNEWNSIAQGSKMVAPPRALGASQLRPSLSHRVLWAARCRASRALPLTRLVTMESHTSWGSEFSSAERGIGQVTPRAPPAVNHDSLPFARMESLFPGGRLWSSPAICKCHGQLTCPPDVPVR